MLLLFHRNIFGVADAVAGNHRQHQKEPRIAIEQASRTQQADQLCHGNGADDTANTVTQQQGRTGRDYPVAVHTVVGDRHGNRIDSGRQAGEQPYQKRE